MADQGGEWTSPSGDGPERQEPPRYGERIPGWRAPQPPPTPLGAPDGAEPTSATPTGYVPPPKPGLIPLHPLSFGQVLGAAFAMIRYNPRASIAPALLVSLVQNVMVLAVTYGIGFATIDRVNRATTDADRTSIALGGVATGAVSFVAVLVVSVVVSALLQGMLTRVVSAGTVGVRPTAGEALRSAATRFRPLVTFALLLGVGQLVLVVVFGAIVAGLVVAGMNLADRNGVGVGIAVLIAIPIGLAIAVVYGFFAVKFTMAPSVIVLEGRGVVAAIRRSWRLTRGAFWRTFGLLAVVTVMVSFAAQLVSTPFSLIGGAVGGLLFPNSGGSFADSLPSLLISTLPALIVAVIVSGIGQIAQVSAVVLVYLDRRMRVEGLDLDLQRFVEQGGDDPFERAE